MRLNIEDTKSGENCKFYEGVFIKGSNLGDNVSVGDFTKIENSSLSSNSRIDRRNYISESIIGNHSYTGKNTTIINSKIGNFCSVSWNVTIGGANHDYKKITTHSFLYNNADKIRPDNIPPAYNRFTDICEVGSDVWIGTGAVVLRGVRIHDGAVIGAGTIVTKDVPPYAVVVGNPGKIIKYRFSEKIINDLLKIKWWEWEDSKITENYKFFETELSESIINELLTRQEK